MDAPPPQPPALVQELAQRNKFADAPRPPHQNAEWVDDDAFIQELRRRYLADLDNSLPRILVERLKGPALTAFNASRAQAVGYVKPKDPHIYLRADSPVYRKARKGDPETQRQLAAQIAHEASHLSDDPDEAMIDREERAYGVQLARLQQLGGKPAIAEAGLKAVRQREGR